ncbi:MAG: chromosome segregation protein SMC [Candidatus Cloacimonas sp. 4484_209]|nr:MAG: chromosome segregation protein SMC [Candidatus Cloacimonas sp. 4484_209]
MKLNRLEIQGFKSFPKKTIFEFDSGIVGIVGPNGCGKTNILEAIKWVLGEQNPYKLRGEKMEDFIFNGSASYKPLNFAEVTVVIDNDDSLPISYQQVAITRRFYRSGESEYFINKVNVRLKDIVSLFLNTGLKSEAYSIFTREMIDNVLSSSSKVRRTLFEEAAGIAKYKNRKKAALDSLSLTNNDLIRVNDILEEVQKHWRSLKYQVNRVKKYNLLKKEVISKRIMVASLEYTSFFHKLNEVNKEIEDAEEKRKTLLSTIASIGKQLKEKQVVLEDLSRSVEQILTKKEDTQIEKNHTTEEIIILEEREKNLLIQKQYLEEENKSLTKEKPEVTSLIDRTKTKRNELLTKITFEENKHRELQEKISKLEKEYLAKKESFEKVLREKENIEELINSSNEERISRTAELKNREEQRELLLKEIKEIKEENEKANEDINELIQRIKQQKQKQEEIKTELETERKRYDIICEELKKLQSEIAELNEKKTIISNQIDFLKKFLTEKSGYNEVVQFLNRNLSLSIFPDILDIPVEKRDYFLGVLENFVQTVVLKEPQRLGEILDVVKKKEMRTGILLGFLDRKAFSAPVDKRIKGNLSQFIDVKSKDMVKKNLTALFSRYLLVDTIDDAIALQKEYNEFVFVTKNGDLLSDGILFTGKGPHRELFGVKDKIKKNAGEIENLKVLIAKKEEQKSEVEQKKKIIAEQLEKLNTEFSKTTVELKGDEFTYEKKIFEIKTNEKRNKRIEAEIKEIDVVIARLRKDMKKDEEYTGKQKALLEEKNVSRSSKEAEYKNLGEELNRLRTEDSKTEIIIAQVKGELQATEEGLKSAKKSLEVMEKKLKDNDERIKSITFEINELNIKKAKLIKKRDTIEEELEKYENKFEEETQVKGELEEDVKELERQKEQIENQEKILYEEVSNLNLEKVKYESSMKNLEQNVKEQYKMEITPVTDNTLQKDVLLNELDILEERVRKFGPVNLMAEEELSGVKKRREELIKQKTDLEEAQKDLLTTIKHIDKIAKDRFLATFSGVRENFKAIFNRLFESGESDLLLGDGDPLETDIIIVARPKNKKLELIKSLSTGERALIAIALLFAFYLEKPSPICILDEIDAPLDDANVERFISLLKDFKKKSQFFVITHNKRTMEAADYLYGITMKEPGVSTVCSVKIS